MLQASRTWETGVERTAVGIDFGGTNIEVALADGQGTLLERVRMDTRAEQGPDQALERAVSAARQLERRSLQAHGMEVGAYAAVSPGVIQSDRILFTPNLPGWERIALARRLERALGVGSVAVCNDVRAGALAELRFGSLRGVDPGVYLSLGTGIAAALTVGGDVVSGAHQAAGEIGYVDPGGTCAGPVADGHAPLEQIVGGKALGERASELLGADLTAEALFQRQDAAAQHIVRAALGALAAAIANIAVFIDPERIVVGGGMMASSDMILPALAAHLARAVPFPPQVVAAHFAEDASLYGAVALALDHVEGSHRRTYEPAGNLQPFRAAEAQAPGPLNRCRCASESASAPRPH
jgi:glucokinase